VVSRYCEDLLFYKTLKEVQEMKVARWLVIASVSFMTMAASLDCLRGIVATGNLKLLPVIGIALMIVVIVALLKMTKSWMTAAMLSALILLGVNVELTMEYIKTHSIALAIIVATIAYLGFALKNRRVLQQ
jgi:hypothetical protein